MRESRKYTLIELVVTLAVIAILTSMLVSVLKTVNDKSIEMECVSNVRQMGVYSSLYTGDNDGFIAPSTGFWIDGGINWNRHFVDFLSTYHKGTKFHEARHLPVNSGVWDEEPWADVFTCGMAKEAVESRGVAEHSRYVFCSLGMNPNIGWHESQVGLPGYLQPQKNVNVDPDQILAAEGYSAGINTNLYPNLYGLYPRHNNFESLTVLYAGGHVRLEGPEVYDEGPSDYQKAPWSK